MTATIDMFRQTGDFIQAAAARVRRASEPCGTGIGNDVVETDSIRHALLNDMGGQGWKARRQQMHTFEAYNNKNGELIEVT
eukprot:11653651-Ditylum_brightwellii.AAC.1